MGHAERRRATRAAPPPSTATAAAPIAIGPAALPLPSSASPAVVGGAELAGAVVAGEVASGARSWRSAGRHVRRRSRGGVVAATVVGAAVVVVVSFGLSTSTTATSWSRPGASRATSSIVVAGSEPAGSTSTRGAGYSSAGSPLIHASSSPFSQTWMAGNVSSTPGVSGAVNSTGKAPSSSAGSTLPVHSSTVLPSPSGVAVAVHPSTRPAVASGNGARMRTAMVGDSPQPCVGFRLMTDAAPAGTATTSGSVWASSDPGTATARATAATARIRFIRPFSLRRARE